MLVCIVQWQCLRYALPDLNDCKSITIEGVAILQQDKHAKDFTAAKEKLNWVLEHATHAELKAIATTRIARIEFSEGNLDTALTMLSADFPAGFTAQVEELKGDIYLVKEDKDNARLAYQAAVDASDNTNQVLQVKLDNLAVADLL